MWTQRPHVTFFCIIISDPSSQSSAILYDLISLLRDARHIQARRRRTHTRLSDPHSEGTLFGDSCWILRCSGRYLLLTYLMCSPLFEVLTLCWSMWYCV